MFNPSNFWGSLHFGGHFNLQGTFLFRLALLQTQEAVAKALASGTLQCFTVVGVSD